MAATLLQTAAYADDGNVWLTDEKGNKHYTCPVKGEDGIVGDNTQFTDFNGKRYYLCCSDCKSAFEKDPEKFLKKMVVPGNVIKVEKGKYHFACPMTGEVNVASSETDYQDYKGKRYYFCCSECVPRFQADPAKYSQLRVVKGLDQPEQCPDCVRGGCSGCGK